MWAAGIRHLVTVYTDQGRQQECRAMVLVAQQTQECLEQSGPLLDLKVAGLEPGPRLAAAANS